MITELLEEPALLASLGAAIVATVGIITGALNAAWADRQRNTVIAFASGILIGTAVMHLIPEALMIADYGALLVLLGYFLLYSFDEVVNAATQNNKKKSEVFLAAPLIGISIHSFVDGLEYPVLFAHDLFTGLLTASGLIIHEFAEGVIVFALMKTAGVRSFTAAASALVLAAMTTPFGALTALTFTRDMDEHALGSLMAITAGALLFVGATHLPRQVDPERRGGKILIFLLGLAIAGALSLSHSAEGGHIH
ncbi:MAG: ZIP family metal transporter [Pseudomonadota bacterium]